MRAIKHAIFENKKTKNKTTSRQQTQDKNQTEQTNTNKTNQNKQNKSKQIKTKTKPKKKVHLLLLCILWRQEVAQVVDKATLVAVGIVVSVFRLHFKAGELGERRKEKQERK